MLLGKIMHFSLDITLQGFSGTIQVQFVFRKIVLSLLRNNRTDFLDATVASTTNSSQVALSVLAVWTHQTNLKSDSTTNIKV